MLKKLRNYIGGFRAYNRERRQVVKAAEIEKKDRLKGRIIRLVHSIEKGMSIDSPRPEFGYEKIQKLYGWIKEYLKIENKDKFCIYMAADAFAAYCDYHKSIGVETEKIAEVSRMAHELLRIKADDGETEIFGGVQSIRKEDMMFDTDAVEKLFKTRHSIRQFKKEPVSHELIEKAVKLAQSCPSACNRQAVRVYAVDTEKFVTTYSGNLQGVGGFVDSSDKIILITGKISPYEEYEYKQFVVSAGIFAGYLELALHGIGLGACVVQRSLRPNEEWEDFCKKSNIPMDEQIICMMVVGHLNDETTVPVSKRFDTDTVLKFL